MDDHAKSEDERTIGDAAVLDPSEVAVENCEWVREIALIDGRWVTTCHRRGRLAPRRR